MTLEQRERIIEINKTACEYFQSILFSEKGKAALDYLLKRGLTEETIRKYKIGFAPNEWNGLETHLKENGFSREEMIGASFLSQSKNDETRYFDKFRNRVMFPIIDNFDTIIAYGGRTLSEDKNVAKYMNSENTPIYSKRENIFSINFAKDNPDRTLILCEGYMDVIALNQAGFTNAIATLGTAFTEQQASLMKKYADEVIIAYDADNAGQTAAKKAVAVLDSVGITAKRLHIHDAKDPDEFVKNFGKEQFKNILAAATPVQAEHEEVKEETLSPERKEKIQSIFNRLESNAKSGNTYNNERDLRVMLKLPIKFDVSQWSDIKAKDSNTNNWELCKYKCNGYTDVMIRFQNPEEMRLQNPTSSFQIELFCIKREDDKIFAWHGTADLSKYKDTYAHIFHPSGYIASVDDFDKSFDISDNVQYIISTLSHKDNLLDICDKTISYTTENPKMNNTLVSEKALDIMLTSYNCPYKELQNKENMKGKTTDDKQNILQ